MSLCGCVAPIQRNISPRGSARSLLAGVGSWDPHFILPRSHRRGGGAQCGSRRRSRSQPNGLPSRVHLTPRCSLVARNVCGKSHKHHEATETKLVRGTYSQHGVNVSERVELKINIDLVMHWRTATKMVSSRPRTSGPCWWAAEIHVRCL